MAALAAEGSRDPQCDFFRSLFTRAVKSLKMCLRFSARGVLFAARRVFPQAV
jgi:hypothetical protein